MTDQNLHRVYEMFARAYGVTAHIRRESEQAYGVRLFRGGRHLGFSYEHDSGLTARPIALGEVVGALASHLSSTDAGAGVQQDRTRFARLVGADGVQKLLDVHALAQRDVAIDGPSAELRAALAGLERGGPAISSTSMTA